MTKRVLSYLVLALVAASVADCGHPPSNAVGGAAAGGAASSVGGGGTSAANATCAADETQCTLGCVNLETNSANCGSCDHPCDPGMSCSDGKCECQSPTTECDGSCVNLETDSLHCGSCTNECAAGQSCAGGECSCETSGQVACSGNCTDLELDAKNCGECGNECQTGEDCSGGKCVCQNELASCDGKCVDTKSSGEHCGSCTKACDSGQFCSKGVCGSGCGSGETECGSSCVDIKADVQNCGKCDNRCGAGLKCTDGECACSVEGQTSCDGTCTNLKTDAKNCGTCDNACSSGQTCSDGECSCPSGKTPCDNSCVDTQADASNCGKCGTQCTAGASCTDGECKGGTSTQVSCNSATAAEIVKTEWHIQGYDGSFNAAATTAVNNMSAADRLSQMQGTYRGDPTSPNGLNWADTFRSLSTDSVAGFRFRDGPRGVNLDAQLAQSDGKGSALLGNLPTGGKSTSFPVAMARGASFDLELEYKIGQAIGDEMVAAGQTMMLAPTVNILRHPFWGRAQETYGEDVFVLGRMGSVFTVGVQEYVPACAKHYAANNIENGRENLNVTMDEQTLREIYARHFEMIIKDAGVACIMAAYNQVNGKKCTQNKHLLTDILRTDFGFKGFVLSDWWAMPGSNGVDPSGDSTKTYAAEAVAAGLDMELPWNLYFSQLGAITDATSGASVSTAQIKTAATRIYEQKIRFKVDKSGGTMGLKAASTGFSGGSITNNQSHIDLAYQAALEGMVLLKNDNKALPIASTAKTVAVIGASIPYTLKRPSDKIASTTGTVDFAKSMRQGDVGSSRVNPTSTPIGPFDGIKGSAPSGVTVVSGNEASVADGADFVVVMAGLTARDEGEEYTGAGDRATCDLDGRENAGKQNQLIADVAEKGKPMVVVLEGGSVINVEPWLSKASAVVMAWYPGQAGGKALGDLLWGKANFSGKLPITWPKDCTADLPIFTGGATATSNTPHDYELGYRYFDKTKKTPRFFFGHGLSYTTFEYSQASSACSDVTKDGNIALTVDVKNTGTVDGTETVLAFASFPSSSAKRSVKELKGFTRATIKAGETQTVKIYVRASDLKYWNNSWTIDTGNVDFLIGPSAESSKLLKVTVPVK